MEWLLVGLGNPGKQYERSRHNAGFVAINQLKKKLEGSLPAGQPGSWKLEKKFKAEVVKMNNLLLMKPQTFMNNSGEAVAAAARFYTIASNRIVVIHDDLDLALGEVKLDWARGPKIHNGLLSLNQQLKTEAFWRLRIGTETRTKAERAYLPGETYVLLPLTPLEQEQLNSGIKKGLGLVEAFMEQN